MAQNNFFNFMLTYKIQTLLDQHKERLVDTEFLKHLVQSCDIEILQAVLGAWPDGTINWIDHFGINPLCCLSPRSHIFNEAEKLKMVQFLMPYLGCYSIKEFFPALLAHSSEENFLITEFLIHKLYSENNSLYPLIKRLEAAVEESHHICILLHDDIDSIKSLFSNPTEDFDLCGIDFVYFGKLTEIFLKLLAKDTCESTATATETLQVLLDKDFCEFAEDIMAFSYACHVANEDITFENPPLLMFQFVYKTINAKTQEKIYRIISEWLEVGSSATRLDVIDVFNQTKEFLRPFISKPLDKKLRNSARQNLKPPTDEKKVHSLQELCRDVIRCKIFEQTNDVKEFMQRIWTLKLPLTVKCFLLYVPDPSWMNNLQI